MKTFPLHPASFAAGLAVAAAFVFLTSQTSAPTFPTARVEVGPHPRDMVQIVEGQPFTVPLGRILVLTAVGTSNSSSSSVQVRVNNSIEVIGASTAVGSMTALPTGLSIRWGSTVTLVSSVSTGRAWRYLAER